MNSYKTVEKDGYCEYIEKKSRFISLVYPIKTEEEALGYLELARKKYYDSTHVVYAYKVSNIQRFSDDGEPQGTAGVPVLEVMNKGDITDLLIIVVRYFGGTMLGAGGLIRAYSKSAHLGVCEANVITMCECVEFKIECPYALLGKVEYILNNNNCNKISVSYADNITMNYYIKEDLFGKFKSDLTEGTNGSLEIIIVDKAYYKLKECA